MKNSPDQLVLEGLSGDNPRGFLAALGVAVVLDAAEIDYSIHWIDNAGQNPILTPNIKIETIAKAAECLASKWLEGPGLLQSNSTDDESKLKFEHERLSSVMSDARSYGEHARFFFSCISEGGLPTGNKLIAKPSALNFMGGQQKFLQIARSLLEGINHESMAKALMEPDAYEKGDEKTMRWDFNDAAQHALAATDPSTTDKLTIPGAEALSIFGFSCIPSYTTNRLTRTQGVMPGVSGDGYNGATFWWPLWKHPLKLSSIRALFSQVMPPRRNVSLERFTERYSAWGIQKVFSSKVLQIGDGQYSSFGYPETVWQCNFLRSLNSS